MADARCPLTGGEHGIEELPRHRVRPEPADMAPAGDHQIERGLDIGSHSPGVRPLATVTSAATLPHDGDRTANAGATGRIGQCSRAPTTVGTRNVPASNPLPATSQLLTCATIAAPTGYRKRVSTIGPVSSGPGTAYQPMTIARLSEYLGAGDDSLRWRFISEFLEEFSWEPEGDRLHLLDDPPMTTHDERWDAFVAALAEHLAAKEDHAPPAWVDFRPLPAFWFPFNTPAARVDAIVHGPAAFRSRGIFISPQELSVA